MININQNTFNLIKENARTVQKRLEGKGYDSKEIIALTIEIMKLEAIKRQTSEIIRNTEVTNDLYKLKLQEDEH